MYSAPGTILIIRSGGLLHPHPAFVSSCGFLPPQRYDGEDFHIELVSRTLGDNVRLHFGETAADEALVFLRGEQTDGLFHDWMLLAAGEAVHDDIHVMTSGHWSLEVAGLGSWYPLVVARISPGRNDVWRIEAIHFEAYE